MGRAQGPGSAGTPVKYGDPGDHSDQNCGQDPQPGRLAVDAARVTGNERDHQHSQHHECHRPRVVEPELGRQEEAQSPGQKDSGGHRPPALTHPGPLRRHNARYRNRNDRPPVTTLAFTARMQLASSVPVSRQSTVQRELFQLSHGPLHTAAGNDICAGHPADCGLAPQWRPGDLVSGRRGQRKRIEHWETPRGERPT